MPYVLYVDDFFLMTVLFFDMTMVTTIIKATLSDKAVADEIPTAVINESSLVFLHS
jgi:hypothetical protein